MQYYIQHKLKP